VIPYADGPWRFISRPDPHPSLGPKMCELPHVCPEHVGTDIRCGKVWDDLKCGGVSCSPPEPSDKEEDVQI